MFVNLAILLILAEIPWENPNSCCWIYSKKSFDDGNHLLIFLILLSSNPASFIAHARLPSLNVCQSYLAGYSYWDDLILLLQISYQNSYPYLWHLPCQHFPNMHTKVSFHWMCAPKYVQLVLPVPSLDMQIFVLPMLHGEHTLPWTSFSIQWYEMSPPLPPTAPVCLH